MKENIPDITNEVYEWDEAAGCILCYINSAYRPIEEIGEQIRRLEKLDFKNPKEQAALAEMHDWCDGLWAYLDDYRIEAERYQIGAKKDPWRGEDGYRKGA